MRAGELRERVELQSRASGLDSFGQPNGAWSTTYTVWAAVEPLAGREFLEGKALEADVSVRVRMRYRTGITNALRAVWGSHTYNILAVIDVKGHNRELHLMCQEIV